MDYKYWEIEKKYESDGAVISVDVIDKDYEDAKAQIKWDGCTNYYTYDNGYTVHDEYSEDKAENTNYIHICRINQMIERLQELKKIAEDNFSSKDYNAFWKE